MPVTTPATKASPTKPTWYVYDQFGFDPLVEFEFPQPSLAQSELRRASKEVQYNRVFGHPYSAETFSGETPEVGPNPVQLGRYKYFYFNHRNDVTSLLKHNGQSLHSYLYDEYGQLYDVNKKPRDSSNFTDPHNHYTFSAKEFDEESELSYFGARYYDSWSGTWGTQDRYRGELTDPSSLHRYAFVTNNPINLIDRYGFRHEEFQKEHSGFFYDLSVILEKSIEDQKEHKRLKQEHEELDKKIAEAEAARAIKKMQAKAEFDKNLKELEKRINIAREKCGTKPGERLQRRCYLARLEFVPGEQVQEYTIKASEAVKTQAEISFPGVPAMMPSTAVTTGKSSNDQCASILNEIMEIATEIAGRQQDLLVDQYNLFENYHDLSNPHPKHGSYQGHRDYMEGRQIRLGKLKKAYRNMGCPDPPGGVPNAELLPVPTSPERATQVAPSSISPTEVVVGGVATVSAGYLIYRGVRLIPSIFFPPSFVPNLIVP